MSKDRTGQSIKITQRGLGFPAVLFFIFLVLKLCGVIQWSWWWVTAPLWIPASVGLIVGFICLIIGLLVLIFMQEKKLHPTRNSSNAHSSGAR